MRDDPVFVVGLERTGTSLMYALLASHPEISMTRRTNFWRYFADQYGDLADDANLDRCLATMRVYKRMRALDVDFDELRAEFVEGPRTYGTLFAVLEEQIAVRRGKPRWGDKSLDTERYADRLFAEYPRARVLHMVRDPRDRLASVLARWKIRRGDLGAGTAAWLWSVRLAQRNCLRHPSHYRIVRYESLVLDPRAELQRICDFIGEPFDEAMLTMGGAADFRDQGSNSSYGARPAGTISADSVGKYTQVLTPRQMAFIGRAAATEMEQLGYLGTGVDALGSFERLRSEVLDRPHHGAVMVAWRAREAWRDRKGRPLPAYRMVEEPA